MTKQQFYWLAGFLLFVFSIITACIAKGVVVF